MKDGNDVTKRRVLVRATMAYGAVGLSAGIYPLLASMSPSAKARVAGVPVEVDVVKLESGQQITIVWRQKPVWILRRSNKMLDTIVQTNTVLLDPSSGNTQQQPVYAQNVYRSINPEIFVVVGLCTHLGCIPAFRPEVAAPDLGIDWLGGYFCPCHGSRFDLAGRVYKHVPAPSNLLVPPHRFLSESVIKVGETQLAHNFNVNEQDEPAD